MKVEGIYVPIISDHFISGCDIGALECLISEINEWSLSPWIVVVTFVIAAGLVVVL